MSDSTAIVASARPIIGDGRLDAVFYTAPRLAEAFAPVRRDYPRMLEQDAVAKLVCALYVRDPRAWRAESLPLPTRRGRNAMSALWRLTRDTDPDLWAYLHPAWEEMTGQYLGPYQRFQLEFRRKSHRKLAEAITPCLVKLCVDEEDL